MSRSRRPPGASTGAGASSRCPCAAVSFRQASKLRSSCARPLRHALARPVDRAADAPGGRLRVPGPRRAARALACGPSGAPSATSRSTAQSIDAMMHHPVASRSVGPVEHSPLLRAVRAWARRMLRCPLPVRLAHSGASGGAGTLRLRNASGVRAASRGAGQRALFYRRCVPSTRAPFDGFVGLSTGSTSQADLRRVRTFAIATTCMAISSDSARIVSVSGRCGAMCRALRSGVVGRPAMPGAASRYGVAAQVPGLRPRGCGAATATGSRHLS